METLGPIEWKIYHKPFLISSGPDDRYQYSMNIPKTVNMPRHDDRPAEIKDRLIFVKLEVCINGENKSFRMALA